MSPKFGGLDANKSPCRVWFGWETRTKGSEGRRGEKMQAKPVGKILMLEKWILKQRIMDNLKNAKNASARKFLDGLLGIDSKPRNCEWKQEDSQTASEGRELVENFLKLF